MMKESNWKSLKYSFGKNFLLISISILEVNDLISIEELELDFLKMNWVFGINFFFVREKIRKLKELNLISID